MYYPYLLIYFLLSMKLRHCKYFMPFDWLLRYTYMLLMMYGYCGDELADVIRVGVSIIRCLYTYVYQESHWLMGRGLYSLYLVYASQPVVTGAL